MTKPILLIDFDGVIHSYESGWRGATVIPDQPVDGFWEWAAMANRTFDLQVFSARSSAPGGIDAMAAWLFDHRPSSNIHRGIEFSFPTTKPSAFLTIDDRCVCFDGDWRKLTPQLLMDFTPWNRR